MEQRRVRTSAENVVQRETSSLSRTYYMRIKREREKGEDSRFVVMQDAKGDERCPPPQSSIPFSFPFQMASRRTSFPRLTASRHAEGNENNEIQRSSVTYARRAPPLNSHLYYLSGSKSIHPSPPLPSLRPRWLYVYTCLAATTDQQGRETYIRNGIALLYERSLINFVQAWLSWNRVFKRVRFSPPPPFTSLPFFLFSSSFPLYRVSLITTIS